MILKTFNRVTLSRATDFIDYTVQAVEQEMARPTELDPYDEMLAELKECADDGDFTRVVVLASLLQQAY